MTVFILHVAATFTMFGVILVVQIVHYPLARYVDPAAYTTFQTAHMRRITYIVLPAMGLELGTALWLVWQPPGGVPVWLLWTGLGLLGVIWLSTALLQGPMHGRLMDGFKPTVHQRLVATNWIRTIAWTLRAAVVVWMLALLLNFE